MVKYKYTGLKYKYTGGLNITLQCFKNIKQKKKFNKYVYK